MKSCPTTPCSKVIGGFTLIELLVAMAIVAMLGTFMLVLLQATGSISQGGVGRIDVQNNARAILENVGTELSGAMLPADRSDLANLQFVVNPSLGSSYLNPQAFFWQAPFSSGGANSLGITGYFVRWDESRPGNPRAALCRYFVTPDMTNQYRIYSDPGNWVNDSLLEEIAPGVADTANPSESYKGWFADNVIGLWVRCLDPNGMPISRNLGGTNVGYAYDSRAGYSFASTNLRAGAIFGGTNSPLNALPCSVEVALVMIDARAASRLDSKPTYPASTPETFWEDINTFVDSLPESIRKNVRVYSTRIALRNAN